MSELKEIKAIVRNDSVADLVHALEGVGITRFFVSRIHAIGAGVDPEDYRVSLDDDARYTEKAKIEFLCPADRTESILGLIRQWARTGHRAMA